MRASEHNAAGTFSASFHCPPLQRHHHDAHRHRAAVREISRVEDGAMRLQPVGTVGARGDRPECPTDVGNQREGGLRRMATVVVCAEGHHLGRRVAS
eukprot:ctg_2061.g591